VGAAGAGYAGCGTNVRLPGTSVGRSGCSGCVLSDGRFAVLGGMSYGAYTSSCEALTLSGVEQWSPLTQMHNSRCGLAYISAAGYIIVAGGFPERKSAEVFDEVLGLWLRLPHDLPHNTAKYGQRSPVENREAYSRVSVSCAAALV